MLKYFHRNSTEIFSPRRSRCLQQQGGDIRKYFDILTVEAGQEGQGGDRRHHNYCYVFKLDGYYLTLHITSIIT